MAVAIVGLSRTSLQAPFNSDWEMWGLPWDERYGVYDRLFEMHDLEMIEGHHGKFYIERLKQITVPLYMQEKYFDNATPYPFGEIDYFNSSVSYMVALAIAEEVDKIGLWGIDMGYNDEYAYQRPNLEHLLGIAIGKGIEVIIPEESPVLKYSDQWNKSPYKYPERYGKMA